MVTLWGYILQVQIPDITDSGLYFLAKICQTCPQLIKTIKSETKVAFL